MSISEDMFEILVGKFVDGEIAPAEQRLLDAELQTRSDRRELFEQMKRLHEAGREAVGEELGGGRTFEDIFEGAWNERKGNAHRRILRVRGWGRFVAGIAAGLVIGLVWHFNTVKGPAEGMAEPGEPTEVVATANEVAPNEMESVEPEYGHLEPVQDVDRRVDLYGYTDPEGNHWIVEGLRENRIVPASYAEGL